MRRPAWFAALVLAALTVLLAARSAAAKLQVGPAGRQRVGWQKARQKLAPCMPRGCQAAEGAAWRQLAELITVEGPEAGKATAAAAAARVPRVPPIPALSPPCPARTQVIDLREGGRQLLAVNECAAKGQQGTCNGCICCCFDGGSGIVTYEPTNTCTCAKVVKSSMIWATVVLRCAGGASEWERGRVHV